MHPVENGKWLRSPGQSFAYRIEAPCCRLFDRDELPWPCCSLQWKGKQPSWNRVGKRFVPDIAASRCPSYSVIGVDQWGNQWSQVLTLYYQRLTSAEKQWWITVKPTAKAFPEMPKEGTH